ncbi:YdeI/OmpD-associated family protein [Flavobacterium sp. LB2R40]|uniref:YdeI/OmpD-associated family protein n=1 Tax=unclassified Flavobacterium TaxID=196869 RepID=UPI003AAACA6B
MESSKTNSHSWDKNNNWYAELELLKSIIATTELIQTTKWGGIVYVLNGKNVIGIGGFKNYFTIWFFNGVQLLDQKQVLVNAQEGVTKSLRQWRFSSQQEVDGEEVLHYIHEAIENEKQGKNCKPEKKAQIFSELFQKELDLNPELATAFQKFSPYKQYEFLEYIETAKREATKHSRIDKIRPLIIQNVGLNDKYR